jgi:hypothetical protein
MAKEATKIKEEVTIKISMQLIIKPVAGDKEFDSEELDPKKLSAMMSF